MTEERITRNAMLMMMAVAASQRSTCTRANVGVVVAIDGRPLVSGYNGAPVGMPHCDHTCDCDGRPGMPVCSPRCPFPGSNIHPHLSDCPVRIWEEDDEHLSRCRSLMSCTIAVHAEANAIAFAAKHGVRLEGSTLFSTVEPCYNCCLLIINAGIVEVVYTASYRDHAGTILLKTAGIKTWLMSSP